MSCTHEGGCTCMDDPYGGSLEQAADREYVENVGRDNRNLAWILSDRDVWYANPFYTGPAVPHPEDDYNCYNDGSC